MSGYLFLINFDPSGSQRPVRTVVCHTVPPFEHNGHRYRVRQTYHCYSMRPNTDGYLVAINLHGGLVDGFSFGINELGAYFRVTGNEHAEQLKLAVAAAD